MAHSKPLTPGKKYHFHVIYNHGLSPLSLTDDNKRSLAYAEMTVSILTTAGFDKNFYHKRDARPGRNIFTELFRVIEESEYTLLILTPGFVANCWAKYSSLSAFKQLLDKGKDHRLKALAFKMHNEDIPKELCQHEVLHFKDDVEEDDNSWKRLIQEMTTGDTADAPNHPPVNEAGDNRVHTSDHKLVAHPTGDESLQSNTLNIDLSTSSHRLRMQNGRGKTPSQDQTSDLLRRTESLQIDGEVSGTTSGLSASQGTGSGLDGQGATSERNNVGQVPRQANIEGGRQNYLPKNERELMTKQLPREEIATLDLKPNTSVIPSTISSMSIETSPTVSAPVVKKPIPQPSQTGQVKGDERQETTTNRNNTENLNRSTAGELNTGMSLTNDEDITFDNGSNSAAVMTPGTNNNNAYFSENREQTENNLENTQSMLPLNDNEHTSTSNNDMSSVNFSDLPLASLEEETIRKGLSDSGYNSQQPTPEEELRGRVAQGLNAQSDGNVSSRWYSENSGNQSSAYGSGSGDSSNFYEEGLNIEKLKEFPEDMKNTCESITNVLLQERVTQSGGDDAAAGESVSQAIIKSECYRVETQPPQAEDNYRESDDSITALKRVVSSSADQQPLEMANGGTLEGTAYSDSSLRPPPEGEDTSVSSEIRTQGQSEDQNSEWHNKTSYYNWLAFSFHCVTRTVSRTDALL